VAEMTKDRLVAMAALEQAATAGPWEYDVNHSWLGVNDKDAAFIAASRTFVPDALAHIQALEGENARLSILHGDLSEESDLDCDACDECGPRGTGMCRYHSLVSALRGGTWTQLAIERDALRAQAANLTGACESYRIDRDALAKDNLKLRAQVAEQEKEIARLTEAEKQARVTGQFHKDNHIAAEAALATLREKVAEWHKVLRKERGAHQLSPAMLRVFDGMDNALGLTDTEGR
jgi:hypothetical protein